MKAKLILELLPLLVALAALRERVDVTAPRRTQVPQSPAPAPKPNDDEGWVNLTRGDPLALWNAPGWMAGDVQLDASDPTQLAIEPPKSHVEVGSTISNAKAGKSDYLTSNWSFGTVDCHLEFLLSKDANAVLLLAEQYGVVLGDSPQCGAIESAGFCWDEPWPGHPPSATAYHGPGAWHRLDIEFVGSGWDPRNAVAAKFAHVFIDDVLIQNDVAVPCPTDSSGTGDGRHWGRLQVQARRGGVALRDVRVRSHERILDTSGWTRMFNGQSLDGWTITRDGHWRIEHGEIVGSGPASYLSSARGDYKNFELRARCKINDSGDSGVFVRASLDSDSPAGYEAQINSTGSDPARTGSLRGFEATTVQLVPPDTWFDYEVSCLEKQITIRVNGIVTVSYYSNKWASGHIALEQHHDGSVVRFKDIEVRELP
jgi:hypothetical protein